MNKILAVIFLLGFSTFLLNASDLPPEKMQSGNCKPCDWEEFPHGGRVRVSVVPSPLEKRAPSPLFAVGCFIMSASEIAASLPSLSKIHFVSSLEQGLSEVDEVDKPSK